MLHEPFPFRNSPPEAVDRIIFTTAQRGSARAEWPFWDVFAAAGDSGIGEGFSHTPVLTCRTTSPCALIFIPFFPLPAVCFFFPKQKWVENSWGELCPECSWRKGSTCSATGFLPGWGGDVFQRPCLAQIKGGVV